MKPHEPIDGVTATAWVDTYAQIIMALLLALAAIILIVAPQALKKEDNPQPPGLLMVEILWPPDQNADVDLWVQAPGDRPVGYSNKAGKVMNLLRDDLGSVNDLLALNYENAYSRGLPAGEYNVNLHLYRGNQVGFAQNVRVDITVRERRLASQDQSMLTIWTGTIVLDRIGQEVTAIRFSLDDKGLVVDGSKHTTPIGLRVQQ